MDFVDSGMPSGIRSFVSLNWLGVIEEKSRKREEKPDSDTDDNFDDDGAQEQPREDNDEKEDDGQSKSDNLDDTKGNASAGAMKAASSAATAGDAPDVTTRADGTVIFWARGKEGLQPRKSQFANDSSCHYLYSDKGILEEVSIKNELGIEVYKISTKEGSYVVEWNGKEITREPISALRTNEDGGFTLSPTTAKGKLIELAGGNIRIEFKTGNSKNPLARRIESLNTKEVVQSFDVGSDGLARITFQRCADGRDLVYLYADVNGKPILSKVVDQCNQSSCTYQRDPSIPGGDGWVRVGIKSREKLTPQQGWFNLDNNFLPSFRPFDKAAEIRPESLKEERLELQKLIALQQSCREYIDVITLKHFESEKQVIETEFKKKVELDRKCKWESLSPSEQHRLTQELVKKTDEASQRCRAELLNALEREMMFLKGVNDLEKIWFKLPVTRTCLIYLNKWADTNLVPLALTVQGGEVASGFQPNCPILAPKHPHSENFVAAASLSGKELKDIDGAILPPCFSSEKAPTLQDFQRFERKLAWCKETLHNARNLRTQFELTVVLPQLAKELGLPQKCFGFDCVSADAKLAKIKQRMDLQIQVQELAQSIHAVRNSQKKFNIPLPPNCSVVKRGGKDVLSFTWAEGDRFNDASSKTQDTALLKWLKNEGPKFNDLMQQYAESLTVASKRILCGDIPGDGYADFDKDGRLVDVAEEDGPGRQKINLLSGDYTVSEVGRKIYIDIEWQAKLSDIENYLDVGAKRVGLPSKVRMGPFDPDQEIAVFDSHMQLRIIPASEAADWQRWQGRKYWAMKIATGFLDGFFIGSAIATGGISIAAGRVALPKLFGAIFRGSMGVSGLVVNNSKVMSDPDGRRVHRYRGNLMLADITYGLFFARVGAKAAAVTEKGLRAIEEARALYRLPVKAAVALTENKTARAANFAVNLVYIPVLGGEIANHHWERLFGPKDKTFDEARKERRKSEPSDHHSLAAKMELEQKHRAKLDIAKDYFQLLLSQEKLTDELRNPIGEISKNVMSLIHKEMPDIDLADRSAIDSWVGEQRKSREDYSRELVKLLDSPVTPNSVRMAAATGILLFMADENSLPESILRSTAGDIIPIPPIELKNVFNVEPAQAVEKLGNILQQVGRAPSPQLKMAASNALLRLGRYTPFDNAEVLRDVLLDRSASTAARGYAILQLANYIKTQPLLEEIVFPMLNKQEKEDYQAASAGVSAPDMLGLLRTISGDVKESKDLRALAVKAILTPGLSEDTAKINSWLSAEGQQFFAAISSGVEGKYAAAVAAEANKQVKSTELEDVLSQLKIRMDLKEFGAASSAEGILKVNNDLVNLIEVGTSGKQSVGASTIVSAIESLNLDSPQYMGSIERAKLIAVLSRNLGMNGDPIKLAIVKRAKELATTDDQLAVFKNILPILINQQVGNSLHAKDSPELRLAVVDAIVALNLQDPEIKSVLEKLAAPPQATDNRMFEPDAKVRLAAISALRKFGGPEFDRAVEMSLRRETDIAVRAYAEESELSNYKPVRDWLYLLRRDTVATAIEKNQDFSFDEGGAHLATLNASLEKIPTTEMKIVPVSEKRTIRYDLRTRTEFNPPVEANVIVYKEMPVYNDERRKFFEKELFGKALEVNEHQDMAIQALTWIVMRKPNTLTTSHPRENEELYRRSIEVLCSLCKSGSAVQDRTFTRIRSIVASPQVPPDVRLRLLTALDTAVSAEGPRSNVMVRAAENIKHGMYLAQLLENDLASTADQPGKTNPELAARTELRKFIIKRCADLKTPYALPVLDSICVNKRDLNGIRPLAQEVLADWRDSVRSRWEQYRPVNVSSVDAQSKDMMRALLSKGSIDHTVDVILRGAKAKPIAEGDPRITPIRQALKYSFETRTLSQIVENKGGGAAGKLPSELKDVNENGSQMIRLAAALVILQKANSGFSEEDRRNATKVCVQLAWDGCEYGYRRDAKALLDVEVSANNPLAVDALADMVLSKQGSTEEAQKVLATMVKDSSVVKQFADGRTVVIRNKREGLVIEEFRGDKLLRATPPKGFTYSDIMFDDMMRAPTPDVRFEIAKRLLADDNPDQLFAREGQRRDVLGIIANMAQEFVTNSASVNLRLACSEYLVGLKGNNGKLAAEYRRQILRSMIDLSMSGESKATDYLKSLTADVRALALEELLGRKPMNERLSEKFEKQSVEVLNELLRQAKDEKTRQEIREMYNKQFDRFKVVDTSRLERWVELGAEIVRSSKGVSNPQQDAMHMALYLESASLLGCNHRLVKDLNIDACLDRLQVATVKATLTAPYPLDPRLSLLGAGDTTGERPRKDATTGVVVRAVDTALAKGDPLLVEQYARILHSLAPLAVPHATADYCAQLKHVAFFPGMDSITSGSFEQIADALIESIREIPMKVNKDSGPSPLELGLALFPKVLDPARRLVEKQLHNYSQTRLAAVKAFLSTAPLEMQIELARELVHSDQATLRHISFRAIARGLQSPNEQTRRKANIIIETTEKQKPEYLPDVLRALLSEPTTDRVSTDDFKWIVKLGKGNPDPAMKALLLEMKKQIKP